MTNRRYSTYSVDLFGADWPRVERMIEMLPIDHCGSAVTNGRGTLRFRAPDDERARILALVATEGAPHTLRTGLGAHMRSISWPGPSEAYDQETTPDRGESPNART